jgi:hypothetical protein
MNLSMCKIDFLQELDAAAPSAASDVLPTEAKGAQRDGGSCGRCAGFALALGALRASTSQKPTFVADRELSLGPTFSHVSYFPPACSAISPHTHLHAGFWVIFFCCRSRMRSSGLGWALLASACAGACAFQTLPACAPARVRGGVSPQHVRRPSGNRGTVGAILLKVPHRLTLY